MTTIKYYTKQIYGKDTMYIADKEDAAKLQELTGRKTMTESDKRALVRFGFLLEEVLPQR